MSFQESTKVILITVIRIIEIIRTFKDTSEKENESFEDCFENKKMSLLLPTDKDFKDSLKAKVNCALQKQYNCFTFSRVYNGRHHPSMV